MAQKRWADAVLVDPTDNLTPALNLVNGAAPNGFLALHWRKRNSIRLHLPFRA